MSERTKKFLIRFLVALAVGGVLALLYLLAREFFAGAYEGKDRFRYLADAFTIPGVTLLLSGVLVWCTRQGAFDGVTFSVGLFFRTIFQPNTLTRQKYPDYVAEKREKRKEKPGYAYLYCAGGLYLVVAIVFLLLFYL
ncbi:MAG: DUF3899 domain-containing protein [Eubacteriales bacterium]